MVQVTLINTTNGNVSNLQSFDTTIQLDLSKLNLCGLFLAETPDETAQIDFGSLLDKCEQKIPNPELGDQSFSCLVYGNTILMPWIGKDSLQEFSITQIDEILATSLSICKTHISPECVVLKQTYGWRKKLIKEKIQMIMSGLKTDLSLKDLEGSVLQHKFLSQVITKEEYDTKYMQTLKDKTTIINDVFDEIIKSI